MYELWLFLHVLGAIVAFGYGFYAPIFGAATAREPQHSNWYVRVSRQLSDYVITPFVISLFITGVLLAASTGGMRRFEELWLALSVVLYVIALLIVFLQQRPTVGKIIALTSGPPGPDGPPPELHGLVARTKRNGMILLVLTIAVLALMIWKPVL